jgi:SAM-dependent methyltransferase
MLAEIAHVLRHAPATLAMKRRMSQAELYATLVARMDAAGLAARRAELVADLRGDAVEIGCGTGAMFAHYPAGVRVTAIEPDPAFAARAQAVAPPGVTVRIGVGEALELAAASMDAAVLGLVLCSVESADAVCAEIARVVRPNGAIRLIEHVRSPSPIAGALVHAVNPLWLRVNGQSCRMNRDPIPALARAGIVVDHVDAFQVWSAGVPAFPLRAIRAHRG